MVGVYVKDVYIYVIYLMIWVFVENVRWVLNDCNKLIY